MKELIELNNIKEMIENNPFDLGLFFTPTNEDDHFLFFGSGSGIQSIVRHNNGNILHMFGELIDNSINNRIDNVPLTIFVKIDRQNERIIYSDNGKGLGNMYDTMYQGRTVRGRKTKVALSRFGTGMKTALAWFSNHTKIQTKSNDEKIGDYSIQIEVNWNELSGDETLALELNNSSKTSKLLKSIDISSLVETQETFSIFEISKNKIDINGLKTKDDWRLTSEFNVNSMKKLILEIRERFSKLIKKNNITINFEYIDRLTLDNGIEGSVNFDIDAYDELLQYQIPNSKLIQKDKRKDYLKRNFIFNYLKLDSTNCEIDVDIEKTFDFDYLSNNELLGNVKSFHHKLKREFLSKEGIPTDLTAKRTLFANAFFNKFTNELASRFLVQKDDESFDTATDSEFAKKFIAKKFDILKNNLETILVNLGFCENEKNIPQELLNDVSNFRKSKEYEYSILTFGCDLTTVGSQNHNLEFPLFIAYQISKNIEKHGKFGLNMKLIDSDLKDSIIRTSKSKVNKQELELHDYQVEANVYIYSELFSDWVRNNVNSGLKIFDNPSNHYFVDKQNFTGFSFMQDDRNLVHAFNEVEKVKLNAKKVKTLDKGIDASDFRTHAVPKAGFHVLGENKNNDLFTWRSQGGTSSTLASYIFGSIILPAKYEEIAQNKTNSSSNQFDKISSHIIKILHTCFFGMHVELLMGIEGAVSSLGKDNIQLTFDEVPSKSNLKMSADWLLEKTIKYSYTNQVILKIPIKFDGNENEELTNVFEKTIKPENALTSIIPSFHKIADTEVQLDKLLRSYENGFRLNKGDIVAFITAIKFENWNVYDGYSIKILRAKTNNNFSIFRINGETNDFAFLISSKYIGKRLTKHSIISKDSQYATIREVVIPQLFDLFVRNKFDEYEKARISFVEILENN